MSDILSITKPIDKEMQQFDALFAAALTHRDGLLGSVLEHIRKCQGKRMRPMLILLIAQCYGGVNSETLHAAVGLELLHTASLVHDDVVDESVERRGQASVNALYDNKVSVLVGDYILSTALLHVSYTHSEEILRCLAQLGRSLSDGEILQLTNIRNNELSEKVYFDIIKGKTAALFGASAAIGAMAVNAPQELIDEAAQFGQNLGVMFQIRDDIFDYYDSKEIGKPTGNDMAEGKLTLPAIYAVNNTDREDIRKIAQNVKEGVVTQEEIATLVAYRKACGGIDYAEEKMHEYHAAATDFVQKRIKDKELQKALQAYLDYVIARTM